jgi:hypothetical protein
MTDLRMCVAVRSAEIRRDIEMQLLRVVAKAIIPDTYHERFRRGFERIMRFGLARYCPCCKARLRRFEPFGLVPRPEAKCPVCGSLERHRLAYLYIKEKTNLFDGHQKKLLPVAPEWQMSQLFQSVDYIDYLSVDPCDPLAMVKMDITDIRYADNTFDVIYCSHVLEHVLDDRKAMAELYRVITPGGWAILQVPILADVTFEAPSVTAPEERERLFGHPDHVRTYGPDYKDRLTHAGFCVIVEGFVRHLDDRTIRRFGLMKNEEVYFCRKSEQ